VTWLARSRVAVISAVLSGDRAAMCTFSAGLHESESKTSGFATLLFPNHPNKRDFTQVVVLQGVSDVVHIFTSFAFHQLRRLFFFAKF
jgi:hypothetical protein